MFNWFQFLTYAVITAATPGPNNLMSLSWGARKGFKKALTFNLGIGAGFAVASLLCTLFCSMLSSFIPKIQLPMKLIGAAYMLYLAWKTFTASPDIEEKSGEFGFVSGFLLQFVNPKLYIYCIVSMETYILPFFQGQWLTLALFALLLAFIGFLFTILWSAFGSTFRVLFSKHARVTNTIMALLLVYCAVSLFL